jgi:pimeloyl-ACP methyl ester carboxylesterase
VGDIEIAYLHAGTVDAPKLVFLHGMAETADSCWSRQLEDLRHTYDCYAVDLRGHGQTTLGEPEGTLEQFGGDLLGFLEAVTGPAVVVGFSMGATIALWASAQQTPLITQVVAMGGSSVISRATADFFRQKADVVARRDLLSLHEEMADDVRQMFVAHPERARAYGARRIASVGEGDGYANAGLAMAGMRERNLQSELSKIGCPVDVVGGEFDKWCPRKASEIILEGLLHDSVRFTEIAGVGHLMSVDDPEAVTGCIRTLTASPPERRDTAGLGTKVAQ